MVNLRDLNSSEYFVMDTNRLYFEMDAFGLKVSSFTKHGYLNFMTTDQPVQVAYSFSSVVTLLSLLLLTFVSISRYLWKRKPSTGVTVIPD